MVVHSQKSRQLASGLAAAIFALAISLAPSTSFAVNDLQFTAATPLELQTADTAAATAITVTSGGQVSIVDVWTDHVDITLDSGSTGTFTANVGRYLKVERISGSTDYTQVPTCASNVVTLNGTGASVIVRLSVYTTAQCAAPSSGGGGGSGSGSPYVPPMNPVIVPVPVPVPVPTPTTSPSASRAELLSLLSAQGVSIHGLIKLASDQDPKTQIDSTIYYVGADGKRHSFVNPRVYATWFCDFSMVTVVSPETLASIPLGQNVPYRPGLRMLKFPSLPQVFVVEKGAVLRPIADEAMAAALYGPSWNTMIDDANEALFAGYVFGAPLVSATDFLPVGQSDSVAFPSDTMAIPDYQAGTGTLGFTCVASLDGITLPSTVTGLPPAFRFSQALYPGDYGVSTRYLQMVLAAFGPSIYPEAQITGVYGTYTQAAVRRFQERFGIDPTGNVGGITRTKINLILEKIFSPT